MIKEIPLSLSKSYVSAWGVWEALRELIQNAIDKDVHSISFIEAEGKIIISNNGSIPVSSLLLGNSSKQGDDETIGQFGEGLKLALLVLARDGYDVSIRTGDVSWEPVFKHSDLFEEECLHIVSKASSLADDSTDVVVTGLSKEDIATVKAKYIEPGGINPEFEGIGSSAFKHDGVAKLFVKGLFVCDLDTKEDKYAYSYNLRPSMVELDRDRNKVSTWAVQSDIVDMIIASGRMDILEKLAKRNAPDVRGFSSWRANHYGGSYGGSSQSYGEVLNQRVSASLIKEHGSNVFIISANFSATKINALSTLAAQSNRIVAIVNRSTYEMVSDSSPLKQLNHSLDANVTPNSIQAILESNKKHMRAKPYRQLKQAIESLLYQEYID